jgi:hypothetical protein
VHDTSVEHALLLDRPVQQLTPINSCSFGSPTARVHITYSSIAGLDGGKLAGSLKLDAIIPVNGLKRCVRQGYEFVYPAQWLADVTIYRRQAEVAELQRGLANKQFEDTERIARRKAVVEPDVAFGPQGSSGEDNISVITAPSPGLVYDLH